MVMRAAITGLATAFPRSAAQSDLWESFFKSHYSNNPLARRFFRSAGVSRRHAAVMPTLEDASTWTTTQRMKRYVPEAFALANRAVADALIDAHLQPKEVGQLVVVSCTGYATPGLDSMIAETLGMSPTLQRLTIGHMGCHAALPALTAAADFATVHRQPAVVVCVELASIHIQPATSDADQMVVHSLFGDGASALAVTPDASGLELVDTVSLTDAGAAELMTWHITDFGFHMQLSQRVPDVLAKHVEPAIEKLLSPRDLNVSDIAHWAVHPGGPRILDVTANQLALKPEQLEPSREVLSQHGNCSSATVLMVVEAIRRTRVLNCGDYIVALAFGPGLTLYASLLRQQ